MSEYQFRGGSFEITMADPMTAAMIAATANMGLAHSNQQSGTDLGRASGPNASQNNGPVAGF